MGLNFKSRGKRAFVTAYLNSGHFAKNKRGQPKMMNKGGFAMWYDATFVVTFGNISNAGTSKIKAIKDGKQVEFAKRTNLQIDKNHINGVTTRGKIVMTPHGFINDSDSIFVIYLFE